MANPRMEKTDVPTWLADQIKSETGKSLPEIEREWTTQLSARHDQLRTLEREGHTTAARFFQKVAEEGADRVFLVYGGALEENEDRDSFTQCCTRVLTYRHVDHASNSVSAWATKLEGKKPTKCSSCKNKERTQSCAECISKCRVAALMMHSSPEYLIVFFGLLKAGITVALLHPQLRGCLLRRALVEANAEVLICDDLTLSSMRTAWLKPSGGEPDSAIAAVRREDEGQPGSYPCSVYICGLKDANEHYGEHNLIPHVHSIVKEFLTEEEAAHHRENTEVRSKDGQHKSKPSGFPLLLKEPLRKLIGSHSERPAAAGAHCADMSLPCCCLYTADLEGRLRATWVSNSRFLSAGFCWQQAVNLTESDRLLLGVQLSHEVGLHALAAAIACKGALLLRSRTNLLSLWPDVKAMDATILWHTGMMWSRLLKAHESFQGGDETQRLGSWSGSPQLRASIGTGLAGALWPVVKNVFNIPRILDFYSPRNLQTPQILFNAWNMPGACAFVPDFAWNSKELERIVQFNEQTEEVYRDQTTKRGKEASRDDKTLLQRGSSFFVDGEAAPLHELAKSLEDEPGVQGACVEGLQVFANKEAADEGTIGEELKGQQEGWPGTAFELLQTAQQRHRLKCLVACIHAKLEPNQAEGSKASGKKATGCGSLDLDGCLVVLGEEKEVRGWKRQDGVQDPEEGLAMVTVRAFLRRIRNSLDRGIHLAIRPKVLMLCLSTCTSDGCEHKQEGSTCKSCTDSKGQQECQCSCVCCWGCKKCSCSRESLQGLCSLVASQDCSQGGTCTKDCKRCCFLFYADANGDAFVPLTSENFKEFVCESYPNFGI
ncbi:Very long-chain acyl-CoA synthetase, related [Eimeria brunetti]|uniref:Very long-chain acyl-CoA synthetase, related n=1 Tax=Eimeria brunetti TaxID=51314 RepID=U6LFX5_9EIME|nr:Very long-chain acyl-CoA synthetase, related [Eimeria brunetti]